MLKKTTKRVITIVLCAVLLLVSTIPAYAAEGGASPAQEPNSSVFEPGARVVRCVPGVGLDYLGPPNNHAPLHYYIKDLIANDSANAEREHGETAVFIDGKECALNDGSITLYPEIWYEFRTYFYNDSDEPLTDVYYRTSALNVKVWNSLESKLVPDGEGELHSGVLMGDEFVEYDDVPVMYAGGLTESGEPLEPKSIAVKLARYAHYVDCLTCTMYYWKEGETAVEAVKQRALDGNEATAGNGNGASLGKILPHTYGYVSSLLMVGYLPMSSHWSADGIKTLLRVANVALVTQ